MNIEQVVREVTVRGSVQGMDQVARAYNQVADGADRAATVTERTTKAQQSAEVAVEKLRLRFQDGYRQQQQYTDAQQVYQRAVEQGRITQQAAAAELANIQTKLGQATSGQKAMGIATQTLNLQIAALASGLGVTGQVLSAFGPWGFAAAVALGAVQAALSLASDKAHELAQKAKEIKEFSEATGLTTTQFQALRSEAGRFGIDSETLAGGLSKFTAGFESLRLGSGDLLTQIRRINPAIADQMQQTTDAATAFTLFGKAVEQTDNIFQRNALLKAGMGKGSAIFGAFFDTAPDVSALTSAFSAAGKGLDENLIQKLRQLQIDIDKTKSAANTTFASIFGTSTLEGEKAYAQGLLEIAKYAKEFVLSHDLHKLIDYKPGANLGTAVTVGGAAVGGAAIGAAGGAMFAGVGALPGAALGGLAGAIAALISLYTTEEIKKITPGSLTTNAATSMANFVSPSNSYSKFQAPATVAQPKTSQADLADMERRIALLGSAATATEKYDVALLKLKLGQDGVTLSGKTLDRATAALGLEKATAIVSAHNAAMGASLSVQDAVNAKMLELQRLQQQGAGLTPKQIANQISLSREQALGTAQINAQIDSIKVQAETLGLSAGKAAEETARLTLLNEAVRNHRVLTDADKAAISERAKALGEAAQAAAQKSFDGQLKFQRDTIALGQESIDIAQKLAFKYGSDVPAALASSEAAMMRLQNAQQDVADGLKDVGKDMFSAFLSGKSGIDAMISGLDNLAKKLSDKAFTNVLEGLLSGNPIQAGIGVAQAGASALISVFTGDQKAKKQLQEAQEEWKKAGPAFELFLQQMSGGVQGDLSKKIQSAQQQFDDLSAKAEKAHDYGAIQRMADASINYQITQAKLFQSTFEATLKGMSDGLGENSPFLRSVKNVQTQLDAALAFVDDANTSNKTWGSVDAGAAVAAGQQFLLSLLQTAPVLTETASGILSIQGNAAALQGALEQLGMSSADAATAIDAGVRKAMDKLRSTFEDGLTERLNTAQDKSYLNDGANLVKKYNSDIADAQSLGASLTLVGDVFRAEGQKLVDDAGLTGAAFNDFIAKFPQFKNVVVEAGASVAAVTAAIAAAAERSQSFQDRVFAATNDTSSLAGQLAAFDRDAAKQRETEAKLGGRAMVDLEAALSAERLKIVTDFNKQAIEAAKQAYESDLSTARAALQSAYQTEADALNKTIDSMDGFVKSLAAFRDGLKLNTSLTTLSPAEQLAEAQRQFRDVASRAQGGDADAISQLQAVSQTYLEQQKSFNGSNTQYAAAFDEVQSVLTMVSAKAQLESDIAHQQLTALQAQVNGLITVNTSVLSVVDAIAALKTVMARDPSKPDETGGGYVGPGTVTPKALTGDFVTDLYRSMLNRDPDPNGYAGWQAYLAAGHSQSDVISGFLNSAEYKSLHGFAAGGLIGNGTFGIDSLMARYAGGGNVGLAGGEYVMPAAITRANLPALDAMRSGRSSGNDNGATSEDIRMLARSIAAGHSALAERLERVERAQAAGSREVSAATRDAKPKQRPGMAA